MSQRVAHAGGAPSAWVQRWSHLVAPNARVLDVACGRGRHLRWFAARGCHVTGIDRDAEALCASAGLVDVTLIEADLERGPWPAPAEAFDAVIVTRYLWRERFDRLLASLAPGGVLVCETFAAGNETVGKPSNPAFLLQPGELLRLTAGLRVIAFEDGFEPADGDQPDRFTQRIVALRDDPAQTLPVRPFLTVEIARLGQVKSGDSEDLP